MRLCILLRIGAARPTSATLAFHLHGAGAPSSQPSRGITTIERSGFRSIHSDFIWGCGCWWDCISCGFQRRVRDSRIWRDGSSTMLGVEHTPKLVCRKCRAIIVKTPEDAPSMLKLLLNVGPAIPLRVTKLMKILIRGAALSLALNCIVLLSYAFLGPVEWAWSLVRAVMLPGEAAGRMLWGEGHDFVAVGFSLLLNVLAYWCAFCTLLWLGLRVRISRGD